MIYSCTFVLLGVFIQSIDFACAYIIVYSRDRSTAIGQAVQSARIAVFVDDHT